MHCYSTLRRDCKATVKIVFGVISLLLLFFPFSIGVEARVYDIQASNGEFYAVTLGEDPGVLNFDVRSAHGDGEILRGITEAERATAAELYFATKLLRIVRTHYSPDTRAEDWEQITRDIVFNALNKLTLNQMAEIFAGGAIQGLAGITSGSLAAGIISVIPSAANTGRRLEPERQLIETAGRLAITCGWMVSGHEKVLRDFWWDYETRNYETQVASIPIEKINAAWESLYKMTQFQLLASKLIYDYLQPTGVRERLENQLSGIVSSQVVSATLGVNNPVITGPIVSAIMSTVTTNQALDAIETRVQKLENLGRTVEVEIHRRALSDIEKNKAQSRDALEQAGFFQPTVVVPPPDIRISVDDGRQRVDVRDSFSPAGNNNLTYIARSGDLNVIVAHAERIGSSVILLNPKGVGDASINIDVINFRGLSVTESFTVFVGQDGQQNQGPRPTGTIDNLLILVDAPAHTYDIARYFTPNHNLRYEVSSTPSGIVDASISGSEVRIRPRQVGHASVIVTAYDRNNRNLYAIQTIPVRVYTNRATIVLPPRFSPPTTINPIATGLGEGVSVIVQNTNGVPLNIRRNSWKGNNDIGDVFAGATGKIIEGEPRGNPDDDYTWWRIEWDDSNKVVWKHRPADRQGWSVDIFEGNQLLFRRPPDLKIEDFRVSKDEVAPGKRFKLIAKVHNNGPGNSKQTEIYFYYLQPNGQTRVAGEGKKTVPFIREGRSKNISIEVQAPMTPYRTYGYGAILPSDIPAGYDADLVDPTREIRLNNVVSEEKPVEVTSAPDLIVESISVDEVIVDPGDRFTLRAIVRNRGIGKPAHNATLRYHRSDNTRVSTNNEKVGSDTVLKKDLDTDERAPAESVSLIAPSRPGIHYYSACVDPVANEENTGNNDCSAAVAITVRAPRGAPDLVVRRPTVSPRNAAPGQGLTLSVRVENTGTGTAARATLRGYRSSNASISANDTEIGSHRVGPLNARDTATEAFTSNAPLEAGTYYYGFSIESAANERNTVNNTSTGVAVTVDNLAPVASVIPSLPTLDVGGNPTLLDVSQYFSDPNEDTLTYTASSASPGIAVASFVDLFEAELQLTPLGAGTARITIEVSDGENTTTQHINISVSVPEETWMPDAELRRFVRSALGLTANDALTQAALAGLTRLNASDAGVKDLTGLEYARQLIGLSSNDNNISDISPLSELTQLKSLSLNFNNITDISPLGGLTQLTHLQLQGNPISDISPLGGLTQISTLIIGSNQVSDISPLSRLTRLQILNLGSTQISDIRSLSGLTKLQILNLNFNSITDISPLSGVTALRELDLYRNQISDVRPLESLTELRELNLYGNQISDVRPLEGLTALHTLILESNPITDTTPLCRMKEKNPNLTINIDIEIECDTTETVSKAPDLRLVSVKPFSDTAGFDKDRVAPGEAFWINAVLTNQGDADAGAIKVRYYLSTDTTISETDTELKTVTLEATLVGKGHGPSVPLTAPDTPGTYYYGVCIEDVEGESDTTNNCSEAIQITVKVEVPAPEVSVVEPETAEPETAQQQRPPDQNDAQQQRQGPDLVIHKVRVNAKTVEVSVEVQMHLLIANQGKAASTETTLRFYRSADATISTEDTEIHAVPMPSVSKGAITTVPVLLPGSTEAGTYYYGACLEAVADETDTSNNCSEGVEITVVAADLNNSPEAPSIVLPNKTVLFSNYPNPFNPDTWIPYQLAKAADVTLMIYDVRGVMVRRLVLGHQPVGFYRSRGRAAHWDGRNMFGEPVASGVYFYTLTAGDFTATRKMWIIK